MNETNNSTKEEVISFLKTLPDDVTLDRIIYHLYVKQRISKGLDDLKHERTLSNEEVKEKIEERLFLKEEEQMDIEHILLECCKMRGNPSSLIHRTIHEFNWFYQSLIFDKSKILHNEYFEITDIDLIEQINHRNVPKDDDLILRSVVNLFYLYCKHFYGSLKNGDFTEFTF